MPWRSMLAVAVAYAVGSSFCFLVLQAPSALAVFFPPAGVSVAALFLSPRRDWPWLLATVAATEAVSDVVHGMDVAVVGWFALTNTVEPLTSALILTRIVTALDLRRRRDLGLFLGIPVLTGPLVGGLIGATTLALALDQAWWPSFPAFWTGDAMGVLVVGGTILTARRLPPAPRTALRLAAVVLATAAVTFVAFIPQTLPLIYLPIPLLLVLAVRWSLADVLVAGLTMTTTANVASALGFGPWQRDVWIPNAGVATLQLFLAVSVLAAWLLSIALTERDAATRMYARERRSGLLLQRALLPDVPDALPGVAVGALYRPADSEQEVGGDWYDVFPLTDGRIGIAVGDVVGHELQAAVTMGRLQAALRLAASTTPLGPGYVLTALDAAATATPDALCSTVGYAEYDPADGTLRYACAGHPPPLLVAGRALTFLEDGRSTPLGVTTGLRTEARHPVPDGSVLVWYSDGLVERRHRHLDDGLARLVRAVASLDPHHTPQQWCESLVEQLVGTGEVEDDVVVLVVRLARVGVEPAQRVVRPTVGGTASA